MQTGFSQLENSFIEDVRTGLRAVDITKSNELLGKFDEIVEVFSATRSRTLKVMGKDFLCDLALVISTELKNPELQLIMITSEKTATSLFGRLRQAIVKQKPEDEILVLSSSGSRSATLETLDSKRFRSSTSPLLREARYSPASFKRVSRFISRFHSLVAQATTAQTPPS